MMEQMMTEQMQIPLDGMVFDASVVGPEEGELVLLLPGFPQTKYALRHLVNALGRVGYRAVAVDPRGYSPGARPHEVEAYRRSHLVGDVLGLADRLGRTRFHLLGHDWGAAVAWSVAADHPDRVLTLTALSIPHPAAFAAGVRADGSEQAARSSYIDMLRSDGAELLLLGNDAAVLRGTFGSLDPQDVAVYVAHMREPGAMSAALAWYRAMDLAAPPPGPIDVPTLYMWGDQEHAVAADVARASGDHVRGAYRFEVIHGAGHWLPEERADEVSALVADHLGRHGH